jgi:hypothetical protein
MTARCLAIAIVLLLALGPGAAKADEPVRNAQREIAHLLEYLEASKCAFYRNGAWYSSTEARAHLEEKYRFLRSRSDAVTAEDFLAHAATASSISGVPYQVRCGASAPVESAGWLEAELRRYRTFGDAPAR